MQRRFEVGVQSYSFRHFLDNEVVARKVRALGLRQLELCAVHADFSRPETLGEISAIYARAGVSIVSLGVQTFKGKAAEERWFHSAQAVGAKHISAHFEIGSFAAAIPQVRAWCRQYSIKVGIHCHGGYHFCGAPDVLAHLIKLGEGEFGLVLDTAWAMQIGPTHGNPVDWVRRFAGHITGLHLKDFVFNRDGSWTEVVVGDGNLKIRDFYAALNEAAFEGFSVLEYEGDPQDPSPALGRGLAALRQFGD